MLGGFGHLRRAANNDGGGPASNSEHGGGCKTGMSANIGNLEAPVDIDSDGVFKYIFIECTGGDAGGGVTLVRGYAWGEYHDDILQEVIEHLAVAHPGVEAQCTGGGRIRHSAKDKTLKVYGYSQAYGTGDHAMACEMLKKDYKDYGITWTNDGY